MRNIIPVSQTSNSLTTNILRLLTTLTFLTLALPTVFASPSPLTPNIPTTHDVSLQHTPRASKPFLLRVMPLGASITVGYRSTDGNGYRKYLREQLRYAGWEVDMVGSLSNGTMKDYQNEGHFGKTIDQVANAAVDSAGMQPNVVLINVGTNDGIQNVHITGAGDRINSLISDLTSRIPNVTVVLSTLIPNTIAQRVIERLSAEYRNVAARRRSNGDRVILAEMSYFIDSSRLVDGTHPDDQGYKEMAAVWWAAIQEAEDEGFLSAPNDVTSRMASVLKGNSTAEGAGLDDGPIEDPELPAYVAPAQPGSGDTGDASGGGFNWKGVWVILGVQVLALATLMG